MKILDVRCAVIGDNPIVRVVTDEGIDGFGEIESVKAVSDLYAPVNGEVVEINEKLLDDPTIVTADPYGKGWMAKIKVEPGTTLDHLMNLDQYEAQVASEEH